MDEDPLTQNMQRYREATLASAEQAAVLNAVDDDHVPCRRCLQRSPATVRAAWAAGGVGLTLIACAIPLATGIIAHEIRGLDLVFLGLVMSCSLSVAASIAGAVACFTEARR